MHNGQKLPEELKEDGQPQMGKEKRDFLKKQQQKAVAPGGGKVKNSPPRHYSPPGGVKGGIVSPPPPRAPVKHSPARKYDYSKTP